MYTLVFNTLHAPAIPVYSLIQPFKQMSKILWKDAKIESILTILLPEIKYA